VWGLSTTLSKTLPLETVERLQADPLRCVTTSLQDSRCKNQNAAKQNEQIATELTEKLSSLEQPLKRETFAKHLLAVVHQATCSHQHKRIAEEHLDKLCSYSWELSETMAGDAHRARAIMNSAVSTFQLWVGALINFPADAEDGNISENQDTGAVQRILGRNSDPIDALATARLVPSRHTTLEDLAISRPKIRHDTGRNIATLRSARQKTVTPISVRFSTPLNRRFQKFPWSKEKMNVSLQELIRQTLIEPLTPGDIDRFGFIYIFWHPGRFGYVKICYSRNVDQRLQSGNDNAVTPSSSTSPEKPA
jgi:hypothetical protein